MERYSEFVSLGHPDKIADYISEYILDKYIEKDNETKYAVEVQVKDNYVTLGGEVTSNAKFNYWELEQFVKEAVNDIGYTKEYQTKWGKENCICGDDLIVDMHIGQQSRNIAAGLDGWGDQGIFFGYAEYNEETSGMPLDYTYARRLCKALFESGLGGLDIKTQFVMNDSVIKKIIVAIPLLEGRDKVEAFVREMFPGKYELIVNGTGEYVSHSSIADCGTTGRKLVVDFYGGNCKIGGGAPWTKDGSKADLALNLYARKLAKQYAWKYKKDIIVSLACCIGKQEVNYDVQTTRGIHIDCGTFVLPPKDIIEALKLNTPIYRTMCKWGLFGEYQSDKEWEK
jgi:S-adenosylmethionine synthetase